MGCVVVLRKREKIDGLRSVTDIVSEGTGLCGRSEYEADLDALFK